MAHIPDGVLAIPVLAVGVAVSLAGCGYGLRRMEPDHIPRVAVLSAVLFVAALVHFPVGPSSVHLILNGLSGIMLGWAAVPAILVALLLQAVLFGFGGLVVLGVNVMNIAGPAVLCGALFQAVARSGRRGWTITAAGLIGGLGVMLTALLVALTLALSGKEFATAANLVLFVHLPVAVIESVFSAAVISVLLRVQPDFLGFVGAEENGHG
jgi:cobalt/nickel transport system permease protein